MAKWLKEHLSFRGSSNKPPPPLPKPGYRARTGGQPQPDILTAYRLQKLRDFEDPYTGCRGCLAPLPIPNPNPNPGRTAAAGFTSPKHRLIKVDNPEKSCGRSATSPEGKVIILEDYADPFDAQTGMNPTGQDRVMVNDGYMEPYEAQRMMAEIRRRGSKDAPGKPLPLYDTPYEPVENGGGGGEGAAERVSAQRPRDSRLPEDDERPPGEYDQPWEWKKERISKAFAVPLEEVDQSQPSPPTEEKVWPHKRLSGPCLRSLRQHSMDMPTPLGERVEPHLPLGSQTWYHGAISRTDAERQLRLCREASYLVRNSETTGNDYSLSLKSNQGFMHMKLSRTKESKYILGLNSPPFDSVPEVIHYYSSRKLPIKGAEHMSLLYPVAIRTL